MQPFLESGSCKYLYFNPSDSLFDIPILGAKAKEG
jgi:hypothetical protein